ncbi:MAG TPA: hypothetical protein VGK63_06325 [Candidatus Limnocylindrales bacterium]
MHRFMRLSFRRFVAITLAGLAVLLVSASASNAESPLVADERATRQLTLPSTASALALDRAAAVRRALGLPVGVATVRRVDDTIDHATYDEIITTNSTGQQTSVVQLNPDGRLHAAIALGLHRSMATVDDAEASMRAAAIARAADVTAAGKPTVAHSAGAGGWLLTWPRIVAGAAVRGDGTRVALWSDGTFHSITERTAGLAPAPSTPAGPAAAAEAADAFVSARFGPEAPSLDVNGSTLAWVVPNDLWNAPPPESGDRTARLAWVVEYRAHGSLAERVVAIELWLDAGSLAVIGGDVAE